MCRFAAKLAGADEATVPEGGQLLRVTALDMHTGERCGCDDAIRLGGQTGKRPFTFPIQAGSREEERMNAMIDRLQWRANGSGISSGAESGEESKAMPPSSPLKSHKSRQKVQPESFANPDSPAAKSAKKREWSRKKLVLFDAERKNKEQMEAEGEAGHHSTLRRVCRSEQGAPWCLRRCRSARRGVAGCLGVF